MLMATLVSIGGPRAKAQLVSADYRKFAQCELATHGYLTAVREPQQVPKTGVTAILLGVWGSHVLTPGGGVTGSVGVRRVG